MNQNNFVFVLYHNFSKYDNHMSFNDLFSSKNGKIKLSLIPRTNDENLCVRYGCVKFLDSIRFQQDSIEKLTESLNDQDYIDLKHQFPNNWMILKKKLSYPDEVYKTSEDYEKPIEELIKSGKEAYFSKFENKCPDQ